MRTTEQLILYCVFNFRLQAGRRCLNVYCAVMVKSFAKFVCGMGTVSVCYRKQQVCESEIYTCLPCDIEVGVVCTCMALYIRQAILGGTCH